MFLICGLGNPGKEYINTRHNIGFNLIDKLASFYNFDPFKEPFLSSFICCILAIPFSLALNRHKQLKIVKIIISLCGFSFVIPSILIVFSVIKIFGYNGILNTYFDIYNFFSFETIYGIKGILIAHILLNTPFATRLFFQNLNNIPSKYYEISTCIH